MRRRDVGGAGSRLGAALALLVAVVGVPLALGLLIGWPLPRRLPAASDIGRAVDDPSSIPDRFWIGLAATVAWLAWSQVAVAFVVELVASVTHRPTPHVPLVVAPARHLARRLVSSATLVGMLMTSRPAMAEARLRQPVAAERAHRVVAPGPVPAALDTVAPDALASMLASVGAGAVSTGPPVYVVQPWDATRDCLWTIAERHLGDGLRWREVWELNQGLRQPDGDALVEPDLIRPGWRLVLPDDAVGLEADRAPVPEPDTSPAAPAEPVPETPTVSATTVAPSTAPRPIGTDTAPTTVLAPSMSVPSTAVADRGPSTVGDETVGSPAGARALQYAALGLPVLAAGGVVLTLNRRRRAQVAACRPGRDIRRPPVELEALERRLRAVAADEVTEWVDAALRALAGALSARRRGQPPAILAVRPGDFGVEVLLATPDHDPPSGWVAADDGHVWRLASGTDLAGLREAGAGHPCVAPALVSLGASPEGPVLIDLEALGALSVEGDPSRVGAYLAGVALELSCAPWAQGIDLRVVGADREGGSSAADDVLVADALADEVAEVVDRTSRSLAGRASVRSARIDPTSGEDWPPTVVVVSTSGVASAEGLERLAEIARQARGGVALVAAGPVVGARWRLVIDGDAKAVLEPLGLAVQVAGLPDAMSVSQAGLEGEAIEGAETLLVTAADCADVAVPDVVEIVADRLAPNESVAARDVLDSTQPEAAPEGAAVNVRVLGPVEVTGWAIPIGQRRKFAEVVAYLATHADRPVPGERLHAACWPDLDAASYSSFKETLSRARRHLGDDSAGRRHLPPAVNGAYALGPEVDCDWVRFQRLVAEAARSHGAEALGLYREGLALVRGEPFSHVARGTYVWAWSEGLVYEIELAVARAAAAMGELALDLGDPEAARWASAQGLLASPCQQSLFRVEMQAAAELADTDGITRAMEAATRAQQRVDPELDPPAETVNLYRHLMGMRVSMGDLVATRNGHT